MSTDSIYLTWDFWGCWKKVDPKKIIVTFSNTVCDTLCYKISLVSTMMNLEQISLARPCNRIIFVYTSAVGKHSVLI